MLYDQTWDILEHFLGNASYEDGSFVELHRDDENNYAVLYVHLHAPNTYKGEVGHRPDRFTTHEFVVPVATYDYVNWRRWVFERLITAAKHEVCEWFMDSGERVFAPHHGNGEDPYVVWTPSGDDAARIRKRPGQD